MSVRRFGVSLDAGVLEQLDRFVKDGKYANRSQAIRFLIEKHTVEHKWKCNNVVAGAIVLVYDHHKRDLTNKLTEIQHDYHHLILSSQHVHLDHNTCLETILVKGKSKDLTRLADLLIGVKGIIHGKLVMSMVG